MKKFLKYLFTFLMGGLLVFVILTITMTAEYGRMANHKYCNMSMHNLGSIEESSRVYYQNIKDNEDHEEHN